MTTEFRQRGKGWSEVVKGVSFDVRRGEVLGIVGESGSGKSMSMISALGLAPYLGGRVTSGVADFKGEDMRSMTSEQLRQLRGGKIGVVFQDPMTSLNPVRTVGRQMVETIQTHGFAANKREARDRAIDLLDQVRIPNAAQRISSYPHELSGGMRQRVMIAIALSCDPELIIADEPTTALDVTVQLDILNLLGRATAERDMGLVLISHDLGVISALADRIVVMYAGNVIEQGPARTVLSDPQHPYTLGLLQSLPSSKDSHGGRLNSIPGLPPRPGDEIFGCSFRDRCEFAKDICRDQDPPLALVDSRHGRDRRAACHFSIVNNQTVPRE